MARAWRRLGLRGDTNTKLMNIMHEATLAGADPTKAFRSELTDKDRKAPAAGRRGPALDIALVAQAKD